MKNMKTYDYLISPKNDVFFKQTSLQYIPMKCINTQPNEIPRLIAFLVIKAIQYCRVHCVVFIAIGPTGSVVHKTCSMFYAERSF